MVSIPYAHVAQLVEHRSYEPKVRGSSPRLSILCSYSNVPIIFRLKKNTTETSNNLDSRAVKGVRLKLSWLRPSWVRIPLQVFLVSWSNWLTQWTLNPPLRVQVPARPFSRMVREFIFRSSTGRATAHCAVRYRFKSCREQPL